MVSVDPHAGHGFGGICEQGKMGRMSTGGPCSKEVL
jgi:hypothetical protein